MSAALQLAEALYEADDADDRCIAFAAVLFAPIYGRTVSVVDDRHGSWTLYRNKHDG